MVRLGILCGKVICIVSFSLIKCFRACLRGDGEPQVGEVTHLGEVRLSICLLI